MQGKTAVALVVVGILLVSALYFLYSGASIIDGFKAALSSSAKETANMDGDSKQREQQATAAENSAKKDGDERQAMEEERPTQHENLAPLPTESNRAETKEEPNIDQSHDFEDTGSQDKPHIEEETHDPLNPKEEMLKELLNDNDISYYDGPMLAGETVVFCREARPAAVSAKLSVLLLHDRQYSSAVWIDIGTMKLLASSGYHAAAVDLPGMAKSRASSIPRGIDAIVKFVFFLMKQLRLERPVIVTPSKSGEYGVPFLMNYPGYVRGFVALAPTFTSQYSVQQWQRMTVPTLVIVGQKDDTLIAHASVDSLQHVPNRKMFVVQNMTHACYVQHPPTFHKLLLNFLSTVE